MPQDRSRQGRRPLKFQQLEARCLLDASGLRISEFLASNDNNLQDFEGDSSDWLEIYNPTSAAVSLDGLHLTDDAEELDKWQFPSGVTIDSGGYLVVFASSKDTVATGGELHTNFKLGAGGEYLGLVAADGLTVIDAYAPEFPEQSEDISYGLAMDSTEQTLVAEGDAAKAWVPTSGVFDASWTDLTFNDAVFNISGPSGFGYENSSNPNPSFVGEYNTAVPVGTAGLYVRIPFNVASTASIETLTLRMKYDDGFVAYLNGVEIARANAPGSTAWDSTALTFHDDFEAIEFEAFDVSAALSALVEGDNVLAIHAMNFGPGSSDFLTASELVASESVLASPENTGYFEEPTPGAANGEAFAGFAESPTFSVPHGFYTASQQVALASETPDALIVYTTDGSTPAVDESLNPTNGAAYTGPITVSSTTTIRAMAFKQDYKPSYVQSSSYLFLDDIVNQSPNGEAPAGWPGFNVNGQELDYGIDPDIVSLYGAQAVKDSLASIPTITLTTDIANLFDASTGIYVNALNRGKEWERAASVELIDPSRLEEGFATNAGLRIRGGYGRNDFNPKHAFRLYFRGEYGDGMLNYPLFGDEGTDEFDVLDLRTASNYGWSTWGGVNGLQNTFLREVFSRDTQADMGHEYSRSRYYHLYLNGEYWGLYMTQERVQEDFAASYFGGDKEDYDVLKADSTESYTFEVSDGNDDAWRQLFEFAQDLADNPTGAADNYWAMQGLNTDGTRDEELEVLLDVDNLIDYMMIIIYTGGHDTGISRFLGTDRANNWFGVRNRETGDQGFQFFLHDNEHSLGAGEITGSLHGTIEFDQTGPFYTDLDDDYNFFNPVYLHQDLLVHPEYVQRFVDRVQDLMFNDGVLTIDQNIARMTERKDQVEPAIIAEAARWGDAKSSTPRNKATWDAEVDWLLNTGLQIRNDIVVGQLQADGLYNDLGAPEFNQLGGEVPFGFPLELNAAGGTIYFSLDGATDPRDIGGAVNASGAVQAYSGPIQLTADTTVWARLQEPSGAWSGLIKADFTVGQLAGDFDADGVVGQSDRDVWASTYGSTTDLRADANADGRVDAADYALWRDRLAAQPTVVLPATAGSQTVTGATVGLAALGGLGAGEENLTYTWSATGLGAVGFSSNGTNASKAVTATFTKAGEYFLTVTIESPLSEAIAVSTVAVTVQQTVSGVAINPASGSIAANATLQLSVLEVDQFGDSIGAASGATWSVTSGPGSVSPTGLFTAGGSAGVATVQVQTPAGTATAEFNVAGPAVLYAAESTSGSTLVDSSGNGANGSIQGNAFLTSGIDGSALRLNGGHVELPNNVVSGMQEITIATWIYLDSLDTWSRVFDFGSGTATNMFLTPAAGSQSGPMRFALKVNNGAEQQIDGPQLPTGQWSHLAITIGDGVGTMYINGVAVASNNSMTLTPASLGFTTQNYIGDSQYPADPALRARIDEFRIYAAALPADQILSLAGGAAAPTAQAFALLADAPMAASVPALQEETVAAGADDPLLLYYLSPASRPATSPLSSANSAADSESSADEAATTLAAAFASLDDEF